MQHYLIITVLILSLVSCDRNNNNKSQETIMGIYCGECEGACFQGWAISGDSVLRISAKFHNQLKTGKMTKVSSDEAKLVKDLLLLLPSNINKYEGSIGCPDCHDQCGIYLSFKVNDSIKTIHIDPDKRKYPKELNAFVSAISNMKLL